MVYVEVESAEFAALQARLNKPQTVTALPVAPAALVALRRLARTGSDLESADDACRRLTGVPAAAERHPVLDGRILDAVKIVQSSIDRPIRLKQLAQSVNVSTSWLSHQFSREIGVPLRRYVLWQRLRRALEISLAGATLTDAAHSAGFSDAAHLSRTFRATFGISPSFLFERREQIDATFASS
jgi:transcriptional regulator GlxA family with amidase domain